MSARGWMSAAVILAAFAVGGSAESRDVVQAAPRPAASVATVELDCWDDASCASPGHTLSSLLPFYRVQAPAWCAEDMACWIGSAADGRSDGEIAASLPSDLQSVRATYGPAGFAGFPASAAS